MTPNLFALLGLRPVLGRDFREEDAADFGFEPVVLLSHRLFERRFGADPGVVGRSLILNGRAHHGDRRDAAGDPLPGARRAVGGVSAQLRPGSARPRARSASSPASACCARASPSDGPRASWTSWRGSLAEAHPDTNRGWGVRALSFRDSVVDRGMRVVAGALLGAVAAVLLIACANLASLNLARGAARQRELAVRASLGASRGRLVRQMLAESALLVRRRRAARARGLGAWFTDLMVASWPEELPYWVELGLDWRVLLFTTGVAALAALLSGLLPAWRSSRPDLVSDLRDGSRSGDGARSPAAAVRAGRRARSRSAWPCWWARA